MSTRAQSGRGTFESRMLGSIARPDHSAATSANDIRLIVASSVRLVREALALTLRGRARLVLIDTVSLDPVGVARIASAKPDVVLVDLARAEIAATARMFNAACPSAKLVAFALAEIDDDVFACAAAGFVGYVPQESGAEELHRAIADAVNGRMQCAPHIVAAMFNRLTNLLQDTNLRGVLPSLTARENEILVLAEQGCSNKEIARRLTISSATVKNHMHNILQKLQVRRRGQAAVRLRVWHGV